MIAFLNRLLHTAEANRAWFHRVILGLASSGVLVGLLVPLLGGSKAGYIVSIVSLILGGSPAVAVANTSTKKA